MATTKNRYPCPSCGRFVIFRYKSTSAKALRDKFDGTAMAGHHLNPDGGKCEGGRINYDPALETKVEQLDPRAPSDEKRAKKNQKRKEEREKSKGFRRSLVCRQLKNARVVNDETGKEHFSSLNNDELKEMFIETRVEGAESSFTIERAERVLKAMRVGAMQDVAYAFAGTTRPTVKKWLDRGRSDILEKKDTTMARFVVAYEAALAVCETRYAECIYAAASEGEWKAAAWALSHRFASRWGAKVAISDHRNASAETWAEENYTTEELEKMQELMAEAQERRKAEKEISGKEKGELH